MILTAIQINGCIFSYVFTYYSKTIQQQCSVFCFLIMWANTCISTLIYKSHLFLLGVTFVFWINCRQCSFTCLQLPWNYTVLSVSCQYSTFSNILSTNAGPSGLVRMSAILVVKAICSTLITPAATATNTCDNWLHCVVQSSKSIPIIQSLYLMPSNCSSAIQAAISLLL